jgi:betaine-aldehyde dehydrogenase
VLQVLPGSGSAIGDALVTHPLVRKISFTGSTEIGKRIMELASRDLKRISLELGGKSPNIVFADADWQRAAETSPMSVFANTGQDCCARSRMFVERSIYEPFVEKFSPRRKTCRRRSDKTRDATGPLVSAGQRASVEEFTPTPAKGGVRLRRRPPKREGFYSSRPCFSIWPRTSVAGGRNLWRSWRSPHSTTKAQMPAM